MAAAPHTRTTTTTTTATTTTSSTTITTPLPSKGPVQLPQSALPTVQQKRGAVAVREVGVTATARASGGARCALGQRGGAAQDSRDISVL